MWFKRKGAFILSILRKKTEKIQVELGAFFLHFKLGKSFIF